MIERGRRLLTLDIALVLAVSIATMLYYANRVGTDRLPTQLVRLAITVALCWGIYRGSVVARYVTAVLLSLGFALAVVGSPAVLRGSGTGIALVAAMATVYLFVAANLFWSASIAAFQGHQREKRAVSLSVTNSAANANSGLTKAMELPDLLAPVAGEFDVDEALESWRWLVPYRVSPLVVTSFGDLFVTRDDGAVLFLDTIAGTCSPVAESVAEWEEKIRDTENLDEWFMPDFVQALRNAGQYLSQGECYNARHSIILGGEWSVENFRPMHWRVHFAAAGQLIEQVKDLPPGTNITNIRYPKL